MRFFSLYISNRRRYVLPGQYFPSDIFLINDVLVPWTPHFMTRSNRVRVCHSSVLSVVFHRLMCDGDHCTVLIPLTESSWNESRTPFLLPVQMSSAQHTCQRSRRLDRHFLLLAMLLASILSAKTGLSGTLLLSINTFRIPDSVAIVSYTVPCDIACNRYMLGRSHVLRTQAHTYTSVQHLSSS